MWMLILAAMLFLQPPGRSLYSVVVVDQTAQAPCSNPYDLLCQPPRWSEPHKGYVVAESFEQGVERYALISRVLAQVVQEGKWITPKDRLWKYTLTAVHAESGFRRDVHEGVGEASQGDCSWEGLPGKRKRVRGSCKSWCLGQVLLGTRGQTMTLNSDGKTFTRGWYGKQLVGLDEEHTRRCLSTVVRYMDRAASYCVKNLGKGQDVRCVMGAYGGGNLPFADARLLARARTYNKLLAAPRTPNEKVLRLLGLAEDGKAEAVAAR